MEDERRPPNWTRGICPIHDARPDCWDACLPERIAFAELCQAFRRYWYERARRSQPR